MTEPFPLAWTNLSVSRRRLWHNGFPPQSRPGSAGASFEERPPPCRTWTSLSRWTGHLHRCGSRCEPTAFRSNLFVHTESLAFYRATDQDRRQPTMQRLVCESVVLIDRDGSGERLQRDCLHKIAAGPKPLSQSETEHQRYGLTDRIDDLEALSTTRTSRSTSTRKRLVSCWPRSAWQGTGRGLEAAVAAWAKTRPDPWTRWREDWQVAWDVADQSAVVRLARRALDHCGGPLWEGHRVEGRTG